VRAFAAGFGAVALAATSLLAGEQRAANTEAGGYEVIANAFGFKIDIPGAADASKNIREIAIDELNIDVREMTTGLDVEYRLYGPGQAHWGNARLTIDCDKRGSKELQLWFQEAAKGKNIRKNITVTLFKSDKTAGRTYNLISTFPVAFADCDGSSPDQGATITVAPERIEFDSLKDGVYPPKPPVDSWFRLEIQNPNGRVNPDDTWDLLIGGAKSHEEPPVLLGKFDQSDPSLDPKPHTTTTNLVLRGAMTDSRKSLTTWLNDTVAGKSWQRNLIVTSKAGVYIYTEAFPVRYVFPRMSVTNTVGNTMEEVAIKPIRVELK
jgi:hypothetical protein